MKYSEINAFLTFFLFIQVICTTGLLKTELIYWCLLRAILAIHIYRKANHTSNTGLQPNPQAEVTTKAVDIIVVHLITNTTK